MAALSFVNFQLEDVEQAVTLRLRRQMVRCDLGTFTCAAADASPVGVSYSVTSPDGKLAAYIDDYNLWGAGVGNWQQDSADR